MRTVTMTVTAPRDEVLAHMPAHREWMNPQYEDGFFPFSGLRTPALGGIVIASGRKSRAELDSRLALHQ
jgi:uncharacterized protein YciI